MQDVKTTAKLLLWIAKRSDDKKVSKLKLQKLLFYLQGYAMAFFGRPFFEEKILAYTHGPAVEEIENDYELSGGEHHPIEAPRSSPAGNFSEDEVELAEAVMERYGSFGAKKLERLSHAEGPWKDINDRIGAGKQEISQSEMEAYFHTLVAPAP